MVERTVTTGGRVAMLEKVMPLLSGRDLEFAESLVQQHKRRGLSPKQGTWVVRLIDRATLPPQTPTAVGDGFKAVIELLDRAKTRLKHPKLLVSVLGQDLRLSIAGDSAKVPGSVTLTSADRDAEGARQWFGRVTRDGVFEPSGALDGKTQTAIAAALKALAVDPAKAAADYGHLTGVCCFCGIGLTDERSTAVGYGPTCARKWGMPWGAKPC